VYPEDEDDRLADLVGDSDYEDDEYIQSVSSLGCSVLGQWGFRLRLILKRCQFRFPVRFSRLA
jgi:hypothetical protein